MKYDIKPFIGVGNLKFGMKRDTINRTILNSLTFDSVENKNVENDELSTNDYFENGLVLGYLNTSFLLKYIVLSDSCEAFFEGVDLLSMSYSESLTYMKKFDSNIKEEEYMGFTHISMGLLFMLQRGQRIQTVILKLLPLEKKVIFTQQDKLWNGGKTKEIPLSKDQRQMGGEHYTNDRLNRAANGDDGYTVMAKVLNKQKWH